jgi:AhpD family alkylhydroperoxidase
MSMPIATGDRLTALQQNQDLVGRCASQARPHAQHDQGDGPVARGSGGLSATQPCCQRALPSARLREQIALAVAQVNQCGYCLAADTASRRMAGLKSQEIGASRAAASPDPKTAALLVFALEVVLMRGRMSRTA